MYCRKSLVLSACALLALATQNAGATIVGVSGGNSNLGTAPAIIGAPSDALDDLVTNTGMQGFDEAQGVITTVAHTTDSGSIAAGTEVNSHMIFLNSAGGTFLSHFEVTWNFDGVILGVMSDGSGNLEAASTFELGAAGTNYTVGPGAAPFAARGLENNDSYNVIGGIGVGTSITVSMRVTEPGDWIRVVTASEAVQVPEPTSIALLGLGFIALAGLGRRRRA